MRSRFIASLIAVVLFAAMTLIAAGASASWLWVIKIDDSDQAKCPADFTLVSIESNGVETMACIPETTQTSTRDTEKTDDGPLEGPHFN